MKINNRLKLVASLVNNDAYIMDVGCDHALLDIYLYQIKNNIKIIASDINEGPLIKAKENIKKYHLEDKITIIKEDGINNINNKVDTIIISGMGGILITNILKSGNLNNIKEIILSPNNDIELVIKELNKLKYFIKDIEFIKDKNKFYHIFKFSKKESKNINYHKTLLIRNNNNYKEYLNEEKDKYLKILKEIPKKYLIKIIKLKIAIRRIKKYM